MFLLWFWNGNVKVLSVNWLTINHVCTGKMKSTSHFDKMDDKIYLFFGRNDVQFLEGMIHTVVLSLLRILHVY